LAEQLGEINDVPQALKESLGASGLYGPLFPEKSPDAFPPTS